MAATNSSSVFHQIWHFVVHLRWHYQLFILSGGYLLGGFFQSSLDWNPFLIQFLNVHLLLFGGATAYNSFWDRDEGAVGGLKHPPEMSGWMWFASLLLQAVGLLVAILAGELFTGIYASSLLFFWLYSSPVTRWKGQPWKSLIAIGISTGTNSFLMGYIAGGNAPVDWPVLVASFGVALVILSLYPTSQIYQLREDERRGDHTFAVEYGVTGVVNFFRFSFSAGVVLISSALGIMAPWIGAGFFLVGVATGVWIWYLLQSLSFEEDDYHTVMKIKYGTSLAFVAVLICGIIVKHLFHGIVF